MLVQITGEKTVSYIGTKRLLKSYQKFARIIASNIGDVANTNSINSFDNTKAIIVN